MIKLVRLLAFALVCGTCAFALADAAAGGAAAAAADPYAMFYPLLAAGIGALGATVRSYTPTEGFWHQWYGHLLLMMIGAVLGSILPVFESGFVSRATLASALVGGLTTFMSAFKTRGKATTSALAAPLALLLLPCLLATGCHGFKAPEYAALTGMAGAAGVAAAHLPAICEAQEAAAVDAAKTKGDAINNAGAEHARCVAVAGVLKTMPDGLQAARDAVHDAPAGADLTATMPWIELAVRQYCDSVPLLAKIGYQLPLFPGVC